MTVGETSLSLSGQILDEQKQPLAGIALRLLFGPMTVEEVTTDEDGRYLLSDLQPRVYVLKPRYVPKQEFSTKGVKSGGVAFNPPSRRGQGTDHDLHDLDFVLTTEQ